MIFISNRKAFESVYRLSIGTSGEGVRVTREENGESLREWSGFG